MAPAERPGAATPAPKPAAEAKAAPRVTPRPAERRSKRTATARDADEAARDVALFDSLGALRDTLGEHLSSSGASVHGALGDAVRLGRGLPGDAHDLARRVAADGRRQAAGVLAEIERRVGRSG